MAGDKFQKIGDSIGRAITKINVKTSSSLEKSKIKMHIESLNKDVYDMMADIGEELYSLWSNNESFNDVLAEKLKAVKQKKEDIEQLVIELSSIDDRDNEILGTKVEKENKQDSQTSSNPSCPNCGDGCDPSAKFCRKCGCQLSK